MGTGAENKTRTRDARRNVFPARTVGERQCQQALGLSLTAAVAAVSGDEFKVNVAELAAVRGKSDPGKSESKTTQEYSGNGGSVGLPELWHRRGMAAQGRLDLARKPLFPRYPMLRGQRQWWVESGRSPWVQRVTAVRPLPSLCGCSSSLRSGHLSTRT